MNIKKKNLELQDHSVEKKPKDLEFSGILPFRLPLKLKTVFLIPSRFGKIVILNSIGFGFFCKHGLQSPKNDFDIQ